MFFVCHRRSVIFATVTLNKEAWNSAHALQALYRELSRVRNQMQLFFRERFGSCDFSRYCDEPAGWVAGKLVEDSV